MKHMNYSRFFYFFLSFTLLFGPLPISAIAHEVSKGVSHAERSERVQSSDYSYVYLGRDVSSIEDVISFLSMLDENPHSPLLALQKYMADGFRVAEYGAIERVLNYAESFLQKNHYKLSSNTAEAVALELVFLNNQMSNGALFIDVNETDYNAMYDTVRSFTSDIINVEADSSVWIQDLNVLTLSAVDLTITNLTVNDVVVNNTLRLEDAAGGEYIGLQAPAIVPTSYALTLPAATPTANQVLRANGITPTNLEWATDGGAVTPVASKTIYVTKYGNDSTGDGSFANPFLTLLKAITIANGIASALNPIAIMMGTGIYVENNSGGPLTITTAGISIVGTSAAGVIIMPSTPANNLLLVNDTIRIADVTFQSSSPTATGISLAAGSLSVLNSVRIINFLIGINCSGGATQTYGFTNCFFVENGTALNINNTRVQCNSCTIFGTATTGGPAANNAINITGAAANFVTNGGVIGLCINGITITNNAIATVSSVNFRLNEFDIIQNSASRSTLSGCTFELTDSSSDIDIQVSGAGTIAEIISCEFSGASVLGVPRGTGIFVSNNAFANISGGVMHSYTTGIQVGVALDTSSTRIGCSGLIIRDCTTDILQQGTSTLLFNASTASSSKILITNPANVELAFFDLEDNGGLTIGSTSNEDTILVQAAISPTNNPGINYKSSLYLSEAVGFENIFGSPSALYSLGSDHTDVLSITTDRTKIAGLRLVSDTGSPVGGTSALRGWDINKQASSGALSFIYQNSDIVGQSPVGAYTVMQLDGFNNQLQLPASGTQLVFGGDTNLYRSTANVLRTDDNFIIDTLTPDRVVVTAPITNQLASSLVNGTELSYLSGVTSPIQTQLTGKVSKAGDIMTGSLQLPAGTTAAPSLSFTGSLTSGLSANMGDLSFSTSAVERMKIAAGGTISINAFTSAGVVHNDSSGNLSSSLIVNADITNATISNAKLASISSTNTSGNIVVRDGSGDFSANMISILGTITNPTDAATKSYVDSAISTGLVAKTPAVVVSLSNETLSGFPTIDSVTFPSGTNRVLLTGQTNPVENGLWVVSAGAWTRPADFASGSTAGQAYVLILSGAINAGSAWLSSTPTAIVDTDPINFSLFSLPNTTTGSNVGAGTGLVFRDKTGVTLNFRSLLAGTHVAITNNANDITFATDATSANTAGTIVARDGSGNFSAGTITASLTGAASLNVLKTGDTMTGTLIHPAASAAAPSIQFAGSTNTGFSAATANTLSFDTNGAERMNINPTGGVTINGLNTLGVVHNSAAGLLSTSLIVNADVDPAAAIVDTKLATISTAGKVANSATTATDLNTANAIVARDASGNFSANMIIANLVGAASLNVLKAGDTMTGALQLPAGTTALPSLVFTGSTTTGLSANSNVLSFSTNALERMKISSGGTLSINAFTTPGIVHNDVSGNLSTSLIVDADVSPTAAIIDTKLATISTAGKVANSATTATAVNAPSTIVLRDGSGNFSANIITADLSGNATTATSAGSATTAVNFSGSLAGDVTGTQGSTVVSLVGGQTAANVATATVLANAATDLNTASTIVRRDASGNFVAGTITANLTGNVTGSASLNVLKAGDTMTGTLVLPAGTAAAPSIQFTGSTNTGFSAPTLNTLSFDTNGVERMNINATGGVTVNGLNSLGVVHTSAAGLLSTSLIVNADVAAGAAIVDTKLATISTAGKVANSATTATTVNTPNTIVLRDGSGNFAAGTITANLSGNATTATSAGSFSGALLGDVTGTQSATVVSLVGGQTAANVATATVLANAATDLNTASAIVRRDASGNFSAGTISAGLIGNVTGSASLNVLKAGDTMTGALQLPAGTAALPSLRFTGSTTTGLSAATANTLSFDTNAVERMNINPTGGVTINGLNTLGIVHNSAAGLLSTSLIINADVDPAAAIVDTKLATIATAGKVSNSATTATDLNTASTIVARDASGNFSAGTITANLNGNATTATSAGSFSGALLGDVTGTQGATVVSLVGGQTAANVAAATVLANAATNLNTASTIVRRDASGNFAAGTITANLTGNVTGSASLNVLKAGDTMTGTLVHPAGTAAAPSIQFTGSTNTGLSAATINTLSFDTNGVERMNINPTGGVTINGLSTIGIVHNSAAGLLSTSLIVNADVDPAAAIVDTKLATISTAGKVANSATTATAANTASTIVARDASGNFSAGTITASLTGNATTATTATNFSGSLAGDVTGTQGATVVSLVGGQTAANVAAATVLANAATNLNTASTIVRRDASGNFTAGTITASLTGAASLNVLKAGDTMTGALQLPAGTAALPSINFTGSTTSGLSAPVANTLALSTAATQRIGISAAGAVTINNLATLGIVHNSAAGLLTTSLIVNADVNAAAGIVDTKLATIATAGKVSNSATTATSANTASAIVARDASGNFSAGTITASLTGNATTATTATNFSGSLVGDVTGTQGATVVSLVGGQTAANVAAATVLANAATSANTASTIVLRDASGNFSAGTITASLTGNVTGSASLNVLKAGDTMTGALIIPAGTAAAPSLRFTGSTNTGFSAATANTLSFDTNGVERMNINPTGGVTINGLNTLGVVHNSAAGLLSTSLIVDADITAATITNAKLATISSTNTVGNIVVRDGSGNFAATQITISGTVTNNTDVATKSYVDSAISTGIVAKTPAVVVATTNQTLSGFPTIDGVTFPNGTNRILLIAQTNAIENGLWVAAAGAWTRPADFPTGATAGQAYVLILSGTVNAGSAWLSNTPTAIIDTNNIGFALFSLPDTTTGANVGAGTGLIFRDKTGSNINFKSLIQGSHVVITNNANDITLATDATNANTASTIVARDASGNFSAGTITAALSGNATTATTATSFSGALVGDVTGTQGATVVSTVGGQTAANVAAATVLANAATNLNTASTIVRRDVSGNFSAGTITASLTGAASLNVLKAGDTMTGALILPAGTAAVPALRFTGSTNTGLSAQTANTLALSTNGAQRVGISSTGAVTINNLATTGIVHNSAAGLLTTSLIVNADVDPAAAIVDTKLATIATAGKVSNSATTATNANTASTIVARDGSGNFSAGTITADLTGNATTATSAGSFSGALVGDVTGTQGATVVSLVGGQTAANVAAATVLANAATNLNTASAIVRRDASGDFAAGTITASLIGNVTGSASLNVLKAGDTMTGALIIPAGTAALPSLRFTGSTNTGLSAATANTLSFDTNAVERMNISATGAVTINGLSTLGVVHNSAAGLLSTSLIVNADVDPAAAIVDTKLATISTAGKVLNAATTATAVNTPSTIVLRDGSGNFAAGTITASLSGNATTATSAGSFSGALVGDVTGTQGATVVSLVGGQTAANVAAATVLANAATNLNTASTIVRRDASGNFTAGTITASLTGAASLNVLKAGDTMTGALQLPAGTAALPSLRFTGSTTTGLSAATANTLSFDTNGVERMNINPTGSVTIAGLSTIGIVHNSAAGLLSTSLIVNADIDPAAAIVDTKLATISTAGKVLNAATTATAVNTPSTIVLRDGSGNFAAGTITASLSGNATTATSAGSFSGALVGDVTGTQGATVVSLVGGQTAANVAAATVLANAATNLNTASTIVRRDASGNFTAGTITASLTGAASLNVLKAGDTMTGALQLPAGTAALPSLRFTGSTTTGLSAATANTLSFDTNAVERMNISSTGVVTINGLSTIGVVHNSAAGLLSTSLIVNADVDPAAAIVDTKLATISTAGKVANSATTATAANTASTIVARDASGNFSAGTITASLTGNATTATTATNFSGSLAGDVTGTQGATVVATVGGQTAANVAAATLLANAATNLNTASTIVRRDASGNFTATTITANLTGNVTGSASLNVLKAGDTMTGALIIPAGTAAAPSLRFTGSTNTGFSAATLNTLSFDTNGAERMNISATGIVTINGLNTLGIVHNSAAGVLSTSLIVNADVDPAAAIVDTKLATISTAGKVANSATTAVSTNTPTTIVLRDGSGNFSAGIITASLNGNATTATSATTATTATNFTGSLTGDVTGTQGATVVATVGGQTAANVAAATVLANAATSANTASTIVRRDASGNFVAGTITANLTGNVTGSASLNVLKAGDTMTGALIIPAGTAAIPSLRFTGSTNTGLSAATLNTLSFDTNGAESMNISATGVVTINGLNTVGIVHNSAAGLLSTSLIVNADVDPAAAIADTKLATIATAGKVANSATTATSANTANTIVLRGATGGFSAGAVSVTDGISSGNIILTTEPSTLTAGNILKGSNRFIHDFGTSNTFVGILSGNFTLTGSNNAGFGTNTLQSLTTGVQNIAIGNSALTANTTGNNNTAVGHNALATNTTGVNNTAIGTFSLDANTAGNNNTAVGYNALTTNTLGDDNAAMGYLALTNNTIGGQNVAIGTSALAANIGGSGNVALGYQSMLNCTTTTQSVGIGFQTLQNDVGGSNTAIGTQALRANTTGLTNTAIGFGAMLSNVTGSSNTVVGYNAAQSGVLAGGITAMGAFALVNNTANNITAIGLSALSANTTGIENTAIGAQAMFTNSTGQANTAVGRNALRNNNSDNNTAVGANALLNNNASNNTAIGTLSLTANTAGANNTAVGSSSLAGNTIGTSNTAVGKSALAANTTGNNNTALGNSALGVNITGNDNTAIGNNALALNSTGTSNNTAVGSSALAANSTGTLNTAVGKSALAANITGIDNTAVGNNALGVQTFGNDNTAIGFNALAANATGTNNNTAVGSSSLAANTTGTSNTAVGKSSLAANTIGSANTAIGATSLAANTIGINNTALGSGALASNTTGTSNTSVGSNALFANTTGGDNTALGVAALLNNTIGISNTGLGRSALGLNTTGTNNTAVGAFALDTNSIGTNNTAVGTNALSVNTTGINNTALGNATFPVVTTGSTNIAIGSGAGGTLTTGSGNIYINANAGAAAEATTTRIGTSQTACFIAGISGATSAGGIAVLINGSGQLGTTTSSARYKHDIENMNTDSELIYQLRPVTFAYNNDVTETKQYGLIAEEVDEVFPGIVARDAQGEVQSVQYHVLPALLLNEVQKHQAKLTELEAQQQITTDTMNAAIASLQAQLQQFVERINALENHA